MKVYIDITEFLARPHRTGIQRVTGELCSGWPGDSELVPARVTSDSRLVVLSTETLTHIRGYFNARPEEVPGYIDRLRRASERPVAPAQLASDDRILVTELFFDEDRIRFYRALGPSTLNRVYFIVYDLLPLTHPQYFSADTQHGPIAKYFQLVRDARLVAFISGSTRRAYWQRLHRNQSTDGPILPLGSDGLGERGTSSGAVQDLRFTVVGSLEPRKNHSLVLDTFEELQKEIPELQLWFVGRMNWPDAPFRERVRKVAAHSSWFRHVDNADDYRLRQHIECSRAVILVSSGEGFGLPLVESLWLRVPVIAAPDIPSLEAYADQGIHLITSIDERSLRDAIVSFTDDAYYRKKASEASELKLPTWKNFVQTVSEWVCQART